MRLYSLTYSVRFHLTRRSRASELTVHTIHANVTMLLRPALHMQSCHPVKTLSCGSLIHPVRGRETKLFDPQNIWAVGCGGRCLDITAEAALRRKCIVLNCLVNASQRVTSIGRSRKTKSVRRSLTGSPRLAFPEQSLQAKSVWGKGKHDLKLICAAKPCGGPEQGC